MIVLFFAGAEELPGIPIGDIASGEEVPGPGLVFGQDLALGSIDAPADQVGPIVVGGPVAVAVGDIATGEVLTGPENISEPSFTPVGSAANSSVVPGPRITQTYPAGAPAQSRIIVRLFDPAAMDLEVAELTQSWARRWLDELDDVGSGSVNLQNDDFDLALVSYGSVVRFDLDGLACFAMIVETITRKAIDAGEEAEEFTSLAGRGLLAGWEDAIVFPSMVDPFRRRYVVSDVRTFSFASLEYDDESWKDAVPTGAFYGAGASNENFGYPEGFPISLLFWWWDRNTSGNAPAGDVYLRREFEIVTESGSASIDVEIWAAADDALELYVDGIQMLVIDGPYDGSPGHVAATLADGDHVIAIKGTNMNALKAGVLFTVDLVNAETGAHSIITNSGDNTGTPVMSVLGYPTTVPGFTPGRIIEILLAEAKTRGVLQEWTLTFDASVDSAGAPWPIIATVDFQIGMDLLSVLRQLAETFIDVAVAPARLELSAWVIGTRGRTTAVDFEPLVNLTSLVHAGEG